MKCAQNFRSLKKAIEDFFSYFNWYKISKECSWSDIKCDNYKMISYENEKYHLDDRRKRILNEYYVYDVLFI